MIEQMRTREELETIGKTVVLKAYAVRFQVIDEIRARGLYAPEYMGFYDYLKDHWGFSMSWWDQTKRSVAKTTKILEQYGVELGNENAARQLRAVDPELEEAIIRKAQALAGPGNSVLGRHVSAVQKTLTDVCNTDGMVEDGDGGMIAFDAACHGDVGEIVARHRQYAEGGAKKNGWNLIIREMVTEWDTDIEEPYAIIVPITGKWQPGAKVEIQWRIVAPEADPS